MAITYPLTFPTTIKVSGCRMAPFSVVAQAASPFTLQQQVQEFDGQSWAGEAYVPPMKRATAEALIAFYLKLNGIRGTFLFGDPNCKTPRGTNPVTPTVAGAGQTGNTLVIAGYSPFAPGVLLQGDYIQVGTGSGVHLHKLLDDVTAESDGQASVLIWPSLRESPTNGSLVVTSSAVGLFRMVENEMSWDVNHLRLYGMGFTFREAL